MIITTVIIDDEADSRLALTSYIQKNCPEIEIFGEAENVTTGIELIKKTGPALLILDISLPDGTAFDILRALPDHKSEVIFITAHDAYAIEAFKYAAIDYLLKPVYYGDLKEALRKVEERIEEKYFKKHWFTLAHNLQHRNPAEKKLAIATGEGFIFKDISEIVRLESHANYTHFFFESGKKLVSSHTLGHYEEMLPESIFCRIHHSHIVNTGFIDRYIRGGAGGTVVMKDGMELTVSQRKKEHVLNQLVKNQA